VQNKLLKSSGSVFNLLSLSTPVFLSLLSSSMMLLCDRYFLSCYSLDALNAVAVAGYLIMLFQLSSSRLTSINQVFVGRSIGEGRLEKVGAYTWQMIWGALLTQMIILPLGLIISTYYFANTEVEHLGRVYFLIILLGHFLFPLGTALSSFQVGIGNTKILMIITIGANVLNGLLDYILINGAWGLISPQGVKGAAVATVVSQCLNCIFLFYYFIRKTANFKYYTRQWKMKWDLFKELIQKGCPLAFSKFFGFLMWALSISLIAKKGGDYLILLSFGSTVWLVTATFNEALMKGLTTLFSYFIGQDNRQGVIASFRSGAIILGTLFVLLGIPFHFYQDFLIHLLLKENLSLHTTHLLHKGCYWLWILFIVEGATFLTLALLSSLKETVFLFKTGAICGGLIYVLYYFAFSLGNIGADKIWMLNWGPIIFVFCLQAIKIMQSYKGAYLIHMRTGQEISLTK